MTELRVGDGTAGPVVGAAGRAGLREVFDDQGFVVVPEAVDGDTVTAALEDLERLRRALKLGADVAVVAAPPGWALGGEALARDERLAGLADAALGASVECFGVTYLEKPAGAGLPARWHQDAGPWQERLGGARVATVWLALTDADTTNGCLRVIPGSHGLLPQALRVDDREPSLFGVGMDAAMVDEARAVELVVRAGDVVVHHPQLIHGSGANDSPVPRVAVAVRYKTAAPQVA